MSAESTISSGRFIDELFVIMREESFRDPILESVKSGTISLEGIKVWIGQALLVVQQFPRFISAIHSNCPNRDAQQLLAENLWEEHGRGIAERDHFCLMRRLANSLGIDDSSIAAIEPLPETAEFIDHCFKLTRQTSFVESMAAIGIGIEYHIPKLFDSLAASLRSNYGLSAADVEYLMVHVLEDETHARRSFEVIESYAETEEVRQETRQTLRRMLQIKRQFAEAVHARCLTTP